MDFSESKMKSRGLSFASQIQIYNHLVYSQEQFLNNELYRIRSAKKKQNNKRRKKVKHKINSDIKCFNG